MNTLWLFGKFPNSHQSRKVIFDMLTNHVRCYIDAKLNLIIILLIVSIYKYMIDI